MARIIDIDERFTVIRVSTRQSRALGFATWVSLLDGLAVESGFHRARGDLLPTLEGRRIEQVAVTHEHEDHVGNAALIARRFRATVRGPAATKHIIEEPHTLLRYPYHYVLWGVGPGVPTEPLGDVLETPRYRLDVIPTPGHTRDHVAFFEPQRRVVFTGDLYTGPKVRAARKVENVADQIASLKRVRDLKPKRMICYHKGPIDDPIPALEAKIAFMRELREDALRLRDEGLSEGAITRRLLGRETPLLLFYTMGDFSRRRLVHAALHPPGHYPHPIA